MFFIYSYPPYYSWIEFWQRKTRQYVCTTQTWAERTFNQPIKALNERESAVDHLCDEHSESLRTAKCSNKGNAVLIEVGTNIIQNKDDLLHISLI